VLKFVSPGYNGISIVTLKCIAKARKFLCGSPPVEFCALRNYSFLINKGGGRRQRDVNSKLATVKHKFYTKIQSLYKEPTLASLTL